MIITDKAVSTELQAPARTIKGKVALYQGANLPKIYTGADYLQEVSVNRESVKDKFFGFAVCQKLTVKLVNCLDTINVDDKLVITMIAGGVEVNPYPDFYIKSIERNENNNNLTIIAYDKIHKLLDYQISDIEAVGTAKDILNLISSKIGLKTKTIDVIQSLLDLSYPEGINVNGNETLNQILNDIAELFASIIYIDNTNTLCVRAIKNDAKTDLEISKDNYFTLSSKGIKSLEKLVITNELNNDIFVETGAKGETQFIRSNPFLDNRPDLADIINVLFQKTQKLKSCQIESKWRGNYLLEPGDVISFEDKSGSYISAYLFQDTLQYSGGMRETVKWNIETNNETATNPATIGEAISQTVATVDKQKKEITLLTGQVDDNHEDISQLQITTNGINASITDIQKNTTDDINGVKQDLDSIRKEVNTKMDAESVNIAINKELAKGVDKVITSTGFRFDEVGLTVSKSDSEMTTTITEDGMRVKRNNNEVLIADNEGVKAEDLHAITYLVIGNNSRLEDYGSGTACFYIGG